MHNRLEKTVQRNCFGRDVRAEALAWGDHEGAQRLLSSLAAAPDLLLCADLVYRTGRAEPLAATLLALSGPGTRVLACQDRHSDEAWAAFLAAVRLASRDRAGSARISKPESTRARASLPPDDGPGLPHSAHTDTGAAGSPAALRREKRRTAGRRAAGRAGVRGQYRVPTRAAAAAHGARAARVMAARRCAGWGGRSAGDPRSMRPRPRRAMCERGSDVRLISRRRQAGVERRLCAHAAPAAAPLAAPRRRLAPPPHAARGSARGAQPGPPPPRRRRSDGTRDAVEVPRGNGAARSRRRPGCGPDSEHTGPARRPCAAPPRPPCAVYRDAQARQCTAAPPRRRARPRRPAAAAGPLGTGRRRGPRRRGVNGEGGRLTVSRRRGRAGWAPVAGCGSADGAGVRARRGAGARGMCPSRRPTHRVCVWWGCRPRYVTA
jgi:hypothetical protein